MSHPSDSTIPAPELESLLLDNFGFIPTQSQEGLIRAIARFLISDKPNCLLMVKGYAGTGKTSMVKTLVRTLPAVRMRSVLLAPTGRAAKVLSGYTGARAYTIHKKIYFQQRTPSGGMVFSPARNLHKNTVF